MRLVLLALLSGCFISESDIEGDVQTVEQDVEFWREPWGPGTYYECQSYENSFGCDYRVRLCTNGVINIMLGDALNWGQYHLEGSVAVGDENARGVRFDLETLQSAEIGADWMPVTDSGLLDCDGY